MGTKKLIKFIKDTNGDAVVEATFLFPIMIMIFAALVLLSIYLPTRASLQRAAQHAAAVIAAEKSDTWIEFDESAMDYDWKTDLPYVYASVFRSLLTAGDESKAEEIIRYMESKRFIKPPGSLHIECSSVNYILYKEIVVTAARTIPVPIDLTFIKFPREVTITATATAVVQNPDEFIRNVDIIADIAAYFGLDVSKLGELFNAVNIFK